MPDPPNTAPSLRSLAAFALGHVPAAVGGVGPPGALVPLKQAASWPTLSAADLADPTLPYVNEPDYGYGPRWNSNATKGLGFFGPLTPTHPDAGDVMGEYSISPIINGRHMEVPSIVPTLTREELQSVLALPEGAQPSLTVRRKAVAFARQRLAAGLPVFARTGEQDLTTYADIPRQAIPPARPQLPPMAASHAQGLTDLSQLVAPPPPGTR